MTSTECGVPVPDTRGVRINGHIIGAAQTHIYKCSEYYTCPRVPVVKSAYIPIQVLVLKVYDIIIIIIIMTIIASIS